jgi:hypothetical protein
MTGAAALETNVLGKRYRTSWALQDCFVSRRAVWPHWWVPTDQERAPYCSSQRD